MNIQKMAASFVVATLLGSVLSPAWSQSHKTADRNTARINQIINGLVPYHNKKHHNKSYRKRIHKITPRYNKQPYGRPVMVDFNRSVNLAVFFAHNKAVITHRARHVLNDLGYALRSPRLRHSIYLLAGHTNAKGAADYNQWLSEERARAVKNYLVQQFDINPNRLVTTGFGEERLLNKRHKYAAINRRVEIALIKTDYSEDATDEEHYVSPADEQNRIIRQ